MSTLGTVSQWSDDEGWGVIASPDTPGGCWASFSHLGMPGYRSLEPGEIVEFEWEEGEQDGFAYRALQVRPRRAHTEPKATQIETATNAYRSHLTIAPDEGP
jgi:CspA family cold shock protein